MRERMLKLIAATDKVIGLAQKVRKTFQEPVNFADLYCVSAARVYGAAGEEWDAVTIEEAAPEGCDIFQAFVRLHLERAGWPEVEVRTEW